MEHARAHGYPVPLVHDVGDDTLLLERIDGPTMQEELERRPWRIGAHMQALSDLHHRLHEIEHPDGGTLLHLDLHPLNVIYGPDGPIVIDWTNAAAGDSALDPALAAVIFLTSGGIPGRVATPLFLRHFDRRAVDRAMPAAIAYRIADPNVLPQEKDRLERLHRRYR